MLCATNPSSQAVPYLRVSGKGQIDGDGFSRQLETIEKRAKINGVSLREAVFEKGVSGTVDAGDRPALSALLSDLIDDSSCNTIYVERADRIARDLIVSELLLKECRELDIRVIDAESGIDLTEDDPDDPTSRLIRQILAAVAEFEKNSLVLKLRKSRQRKKATGTGGKEGPKPFGEKAGERKTMVALRDLAFKGHGPTEIARQLNEKGLPPRKGGLWSKQTVSTILRRTKTQLT